MPCQFVRPIPFLPWLRINVCLCVLLVFVGSGLEVLIAEWRLDHDFTRFALMVTAPFLFCVSLVRRRPFDTTLDFVR